MNLRIESLLQSAEPFEVCVVDLPILLGRGDAVDIVISDQWVSRVHSAIEADHGRAVLRDLGSRNGTFLNRQRVAEAELHDGDRIDLGLTTLIVRDAP